MTLLGAFQNLELNTCIEVVHFCGTQWLDGWRLPISTGSCFLVCYRESLLGISGFGIVVYQALDKSFSDYFAPSLGATPVCFLGLSWGWGEVGVVHHFSDREIP